MAGAIWVFAEHQDGKIRKTALELMGKGRELSIQLRAPLIALLLGSSVDDLAQELTAHVDTVYHWDDTVLARYNSEIYCHIIAELAQQEKPQIVLAGATFLARDLFPRLAGRLKTGIAVDCLSVELGEDGLLVARRPLFGGKALADVVCRDGRPQMVLVRPNTFSLPEVKGSTRGAIKPMPVDVDPAHIKIQVLEVNRPPKERLDLTEAEVIVTGGRGMKGAENFELLEELADVLNATVGASRGVVDSGWRPHGDQVGKSGKTVSPKLYFAVGVSGAIHHVMGMDTSKVVVAINKDVQAPIFQYADYGIVGDLFEVLPLLTKEMKQEMGED
jgi:electron transfer flavoprotein alpha subunit